MISFLIAVIVALCVFFHGQLDEGNSWKSSVRFTSTAIITVTMSYIAFLATGWWGIVPLVAVSGWCAFVSGPRIGWSRVVMWNQFGKGLWLAAPLFPFGVAYSLLRPLSYWVGYTRFPALPHKPDRPDEISRMLSGAFLGIICGVAYSHIAISQLLAERLGDCCVPAVLLFGQQIFNNHFGVQL